MDDMHPGEMQRSLVRIEASLADLTEDVRTRDHAMRDLVNAQIGPITTHGVKIQQLQDELSAVKAQRFQVGNWIVGGVTALLAGVCEWLLHGSAQK
jgi:hypothetical protein